ncbi:hypothetical protein [Endozoicomonas arenosclerae]|uniref:hypothetical protein n=1 Tax=Endozoicomonas arenosclerae TaxID=1633495 RepID=UPI0012948171|nr:hypothetical protein [Endozoicomonas arenosclerae]
MPEQQTLYAFICMVDKKQLGINPANYNGCLIMGSQGVVESPSFTTPFKSRKSLFRFFYNNTKDKNNQRSPWIFQNNSLCYEPLEEESRVCFLPYIHKKMIERSLNSIYSGSGSGNGDTTERTHGKSTTLPPSEEDPYRDLKTIGIVAAALVVIMVIYGTIQGVREYALKRGHAI